MSRKEPLVRWSRNWAKNWREVAESSALRPLLPLYLFNEFIYWVLHKIKLCINALHGAVAVPYTTDIFYPYTILAIQLYSILIQFLFSILFVHRIELASICRWQRYVWCMIQVHVMTDNLVSVTYIWMLKLSGVLHSVWKVSLCVLSEIKRAGGPCLWDWQLDPKEDTKTITGMRFSCPNRSLWYHFKQMYPALWAVFRQITNTPVFTFNSLSEFNILWLLTSS